MKKANIARKTFKVSIKPSFLKLVSVDIFVLLPTIKTGVKYVFVMVDFFSKYTKLFPIAQANTETLLNKLMFREVGYYVPARPRSRREGVIRVAHARLATHRSCAQGMQCFRPNALLCKLDLKCGKSDHSSQFTSEFWQKTLKNLNIVPTTPLLSVILRKGVCRQLATSFSRIVIRINKYSGTVDLNQLSKRNENINIKENRQKKKSIRKLTKVTKLKAGDLVFRRTCPISSLWSNITKKLFGLYVGQYRIQSVVNENCYTLEMLEGKELVCRGPVNECILLAKLRALGANLFPSCASPFSPPTLDNIKQCIPPPDLLLLPHIVCLYNLCFSSKAVELLHLQLYSSHVGRCHFLWQFDPAESKKLWYNDLCVNVKWWVKWDPLEENRLVSFVMVLRGNQCGREIAHRWFVCSATSMVCIDIYPLEMFAVMLGMEELGSSAMGLNDLNG
ncbi:hypothetical protein PR048_002468 [Dryococelus australis]|uniref:Integrase catalytic domain-containing protein n=1 Tax=Dryococelus australis TaxID=614101 RepID=A0ABQ9IKA8_9NEOP|nr:hypothetical protein PR048_002468 [Dryococelus australis]